MPGRRLAVIMHRIWLDGTDFRWTQKSLQRQHDDRARSNAIGEYSTSTEVVESMSLAGRWMR